MFLSPRGGGFDKHSQKFYNNYSKHTLFGKMLLPKDLNDIVCFLISEKSKNITGQEIIIDSGFVL
jgi:enoyl-[acyl-carrier-protein] reductase (NADH)